MSVIVPHLNLDFLLAASMAVDVVGSSIEGGRNGLGEAQAIGMSGGGMVTLTYSNCLLHEAQGHRYLNAIAGRMNGSVRSLVVPIVTDIVGPFPLDDDDMPQPYVSGIPFDDGSTFSDGSGFKQAAAYGLIDETAPLNAGTIKMRLYGGQKLFGGEWFSINHSQKGWRAYRGWEIDSMVKGSGYDTYTLAIGPALRQAVAKGDRVEFAQPRCLMRFPAGFTLPWTPEAGWLSRPTLSFVEAFGVL